MSLAAHLDLFYGPPLDVLANCLRAFIVAAPGHDLIGADFSAIEARGLAWLADEREDLAVFRANQDIYLKSASDIYNRPITKDDKDERQIGKVSTLALGYQGGVGAFQTMAKGYGVKVTDKAANDIKVAWRLSHPNVVAYWRDVGAAAIAAVSASGTKQSAGPGDGRAVTFLKKGSFLFCRLPSGRALCYPYPRLAQHVWVKPEGSERARTAEVNIARKLATQGKLTIESDPFDALYYAYVEADTRRWVSGPTYGGSLVENITQAVCRDLLAEAIKRAEAADYPVVFHVHDELVAEIAHGFGSLDEFGRIVTQVPSWAKGFPIDAKPWRGRRYRKD